MLHWVFSPNARTFLKFVMYTPTNSSDLLLTIIVNSLAGGKTRILSLRGNDDV
jgi:hypothetical protein